MSKSSERTEPDQPPSFNPGAERVLQRLTAEYDQVHWEPSGKPVDELVATILSQNTSDINTDRAFDALKTRFEDWEAVRDAPTGEVAHTIRAGGLADQKAPRIQHVLAEILSDEPGDQNQRFLKELQTLGLTGAMERLTALPGVGPKTASCVLMFAVGLPALPVDTHVYRVAHRIGLIETGVDANRAHEVLRRQVPADDVYRFHVLMIRHGRTVCRARRPLCEACVVSDICQYRQRLVEST